MPQSRPTREYSTGSTSPASAEPAAMQRSRPRRVSRDRSRRFALGLVAVMTMVSLLLGWGLSSLSQAMSLTAQPGVVQSDLVAQAPADQDSDWLRTVDYVPESYRLGQRLYLENCASCHIGVPPETLPSEAWRNIIQDSSHYGTEINPPRDPSLGLMWSYLRSFSRLKSNTEERVPYRLGRSRYFKALHPDVTLSAEVSLESCATCHRAAQQFSFRPWNEAATNP